jgi:hypothetical protein
MEPPVQGILPRVALALWCMPLGAQFVGVLPLGQLLPASALKEPLVQACRNLEPLVLGVINLKKLLGVKKNRSISSLKRCTFPDRSTGAIWDYSASEIKVSRF